MAIPPTMVDWGAVVPPHPEPIAVTPTVTAATYASGDAVGGLMTFSGVGHSGRVVSVEVFDKAGNAVAYSLELFKNSDFTATATDATFDPTDTHLLLSAMQPIPIANAESYNDNGRVNAGDIARAFRTRDGKFYGQLVTWGAPVYASTSDITVQITVEPD